MQCYRPHRRVPRNGSTTTAETAPTEDEQNKNEIGYLIDDSTDYFVKNNNGVQDAGLVQSKWLDLMNIEYWWVKLPLHRAL
jgi:hypothetical protein